MDLIESASTLEQIMIQNFFSIIKESKYGSYRKRFYPGADYDTKSKT